MLKFVARISIILFMVYIANPEELIRNPVEPVPGVPAITEDLPFILIKAENGQLALPSNVEIIKKLWKKKKIQFKWSLFDKQEFYCPAENDKQKSKIALANKIFDSDPNRVGDKLDNNCLFKKKKTKKTDSRFPICNKQPEPKLMKELSPKQPTETGLNNQIALKKEPTPCGSEKKGQTLIFGYEICEEYEGIFQKIGYKFSNKQKVYPIGAKRVTIYEICYEFEKKEILYTSHAILAPLLLKDYLLEKERSKPPANIMATNELQHMSDINFNDFKSELEEIQKSSEFKIQLLIPLQDFPFVAWKRPVYHFVNASLMHEKLQSCWNSIHDMIRNDAIKTPRKLNIFTRAFRYFDTPAGKKWKYEEKSKIIPSLWVKLVHFRINYNKEHDAVAIIANNYRDNAVREIISEEFECENNLCWRFIKGENCKGLNRDIRCCKVNDQIKQLFGLTSKFNDILDIADLIDQDPELTTTPAFQRMKTSPERLPYK